MCFLLSYEHLKLNLNIVQIYMLIREKTDDLGNFLKKMSERLSNFFVKSLYNKGVR